MLIKVNKSIATYDVASLILLAFLAFYFFKVFQFQQSFMMHPWITGDWLINYSNGFIRRGFVGALIDESSKLFNASSLKLVIQVKFVFYTIWLVFFYLLAIRKK
jgi:hypothetical protein